MVLLVTFLLLIAAVATLVIEVAEHRAPTPVALLTLGHLGYVALNPIIFLVSPASADYFVWMVETGADVTHAGIGRVLAAALLFQLGCLGVALLPKGNVKRPVLELDRDSTAGLIRAGYFLMALGAIGIISLGFSYNGSPLGMYAIAYGERTVYFFSRGPQAFLVELAKYGGSLLIAAYLLSKRPLAAGLILFLIALHGAGMKSKAPIIHALCVYLVAFFIATGRRRLRWLAPPGLALAVVLVLGVARSTRDSSLGAMFGFVQENQGLVMDSMTSPWANDLPGPAAASYLVVNASDEELSIEPLTETAVLLVPKFIYDRGLTQSDQFARKLFRGSYFTGSGMGWSLIADGFRLLGFAGVAFLAALLAALGARFQQIRAGASSLATHRAAILLCICAPTFLLAPRTGLAAFVKALLITCVVSLAPARFFRRRRPSELVVDRPAEPLRGVTIDAAR